VLATRLLGYLRVPRSADCAANLLFVLTKAEEERVADARSGGPEDDMVHEQIVLADLITLANVGKDHVEPGQGGSVAEAYVTDTPDGESAEIVSSGGSRYRLRLERLQRHGHSHGESW
jgi:hypothetical protein